MLGIEAIGDDARSRARFRDGGAVSFRHALAHARGRERKLFAEEARYANRPRAWVARITGRDLRFGLTRAFLGFNRDYTEADAVGSRGVFLWYELPEGGVYEVHAPQSWTEADRYFCRSERGRIVRMTREEVDQWIASAASASTS